MSTKPNHLTLSKLNRTQLAAASGLSCSGISRILSTDPKQRRGKFPRLETLLKLQRGLKSMTRQSYTIEQIAMAIRKVRTGGQRTAAVADSEAPSAPHSG